VPDSAPASADAPAAPGDPSSRRDRRPPRFDRQFFLAVLITALLVVPRTALVSRAHSEYWDDQPHLSQGLSVIFRTDTHVYHNDPPLGQILMALPLVATGCVPESPAAYDARAATQPATAAADARGHRAAPPYLAVLYDQRLAPETLSLLVALWKAILFVPFGGLVFHWCRSVYGLASGWLGLALVLVEPTIAGHIAPAALDVLGTEAILFACYCAWRYFESPARWRLVLAGVSAAAALLTKHTAIILPGVIVVYALLWRVVYARRVLKRPVAWRAMVNELLAGALVVVAAIWPLTLFDVSRPSQSGPLLRTQYTQGFSFGGDVVNAALSRRWPAGVYIGSICFAAQHAGGGHPAYLFGHASNDGWWWYFFAVALYKVPIGIAVVLLLGLASLRRVPVRWGETPLLVAAAASGIFLSLQRIDIGFRHILPAYVPLLMLASRCAAGGVWLRVGAWLGVAVAAVHVASFHPDYLSYVNFPRRNVQLQISDSNLDWGQSLKQVRAWLDAHPPGDRPVWLAYFGNLEGRSVRHYLDGRVKQIDLSSDQPSPRSGLLILSPVCETGQYDSQDRFAWLRQAERRGQVRPIAIIGHCMRVFDLDRVAAAGEAGGR
jgi:hypothetical protein